MSCSRFQRFRRCFPVGNMIYWPCHAMDRDNSGVQEAVRDKQGRNRGGIIPTAGENRTQASGHRNRQSWRKSCPEIRTRRCFWKRFPMNTSMRIRCRSDRIVTSHCVRIQRMAWFFANECLMKGCQKHNDSKGSILLSGLRGKADRASSRRRGNGSVL